MPVRPDTCQWFVMATGCLSKYNMPKIEGTDLFEGRKLTTHSFPKDGVDFTGRKVGIIGTGSTAVQTIPEVSKQAEKLIVFQRTPAYVSPAQVRPWCSALPRSRSNNGRGSILSHRSVQDCERGAGQYDPAVEEWKKKSQRETGFGMDIEANDTPYAEQDPAEFLVGRRLGSSENHHYSSGVFWLV